MNYMEPIRDKDTIIDMINYFKNDNERNYILFLMGIYTGLRISDILKLRIRDVAGKKSLNIRDNKTNKRNRIEFHPKLRKALDHYTQNKEPLEYLIKSRKGKNRPITRGQAYKIIRKAADLYDLDYIGVHSTRKTIGYHLYKNTHNIVLVQDVLNHSKSASYTESYVGINSEILNKAIKKLPY